MMSDPQPQKYRSIYESAIEHAQKTDESWFTPLNTMQLLNRVKIDTKNEHRADHIISALCYDKRLATKRWLNYVTKIAKDHCAETGKSMRVAYSLEVRECAASKLEKAFRIKVMEHILRVN